MSPSGEAWSGCPPGGGMRRRVPPGRSARRRGPAAPRVSRRGTRPVPRRPPHPPSPHFPSLSRKTKSLRRGPIPEKSRVLHQFPHPSPEAPRGLAIDEAVVYREAHGHPLANHDPVPVHDRLLPRLPDPPDCTLGGVDVPPPPPPAVTAEVGQREGSPRNLLRKQLLLPGPLDKVRQSPVNLRQRHPVRVVEHRNDQPFGDRHCDADVHIPPIENLPALDGSVENGHLLQDAG